MRHVLTVALMTLSLSASAHWEVDTTVPDWVRRGDLHWALHYSRVTGSDVDLMIAARQNLNHGAGYDSPETRRRAAEGGIRDLVYICSRTFTIKDYEKHPELRNAVVRAPDGSEILAYNNPVRRYGCVNGPEWKSFVLEKTVQVQATRNPAGIFYDNEAWFEPCYCPVCRGKFRDYSRSRYGREMELPVPADASTEDGRAAIRFRLDSQTAYHKALADFCHQASPRLLCVPNTCGMGAWPLHGIREGVTDLPFYELSSHPPFGDNLYAYKVALAAGHGRNVGGLMYLPGAVACDRAARVWHEGMHSFFNPASPLAKEIALGIAEGAACDATYVANYSLFPSLPITSTNDPFTVNIQRTMNRSYAFLAAHRDLYLNASPGGEIAILHSISTDLFRRQHRRWADMAQRLNRAGLPYEILVEDDLTPARLAGYRALLIPDAAVLADDGAQALRGYASGGGRILLGGDCGTLDDRGGARTNTALLELPRDADLLSMDGARLRGLVATRAGLPRISVQNPTGKLSVNVLGLPALKVRGVHLLNYDFEYGRPENLIADDDGTGGVRGYLSDTRWRIRKTLVVPEPAKIAQPVLHIVGSPNTAKELIRLVVSLNGTDIATVAPKQLTGRIEVPLTKDLLRPGPNEVVLRIEGEPNVRNEWYQVSLDGAATSRRSYFSRDGGKTWAQDDLCQDAGAQTGEFLIRLADGTRMPTHAEWEQLCRVRPAAGIRVRVAGDRAPAAVALSPESDARAVTASPVEGGWEYAVDVGTYTVLLLAESPSDLSRWLPKTPSP